MIKTIRSRNNRYKMGILMLVRRHMFIEGSPWTRPLVKTVFPGMVIRHSWDFFAQNSNQGKWNFPVVWIARRKNAIFAIFQLLVENQTSMNRVGSLGVFHVGYRSWDRLIFVVEISIPEKTVFILRLSPRSFLDSNIEVIQSCYHTATSGWCITMTS